MTDHHDHDHDHDHDHHHDDHDPSDGPPDPQLDPSRSPGFGTDPTAIEEIDVGRDVTLGDAEPAELTVGDRSSVDGAAIPALVSLLRNGDATQRGRAALALADRPGAAADAVSTVAAAAIEDADADVRQFAVEALGKIGGPAAGPAAKRVLRDEDPWVRAEAVDALDRIDREGHAETIEAAVDDDHHAVRRNAAISLFKRRGEDALPMLLDLAEDPSNRAREWAAHMLGGVDDDRARDALESLATGDENEIVRVTARKSLDADPARFRRKFAGAADRDRQPLPGEDLLNRRPDL